MQRRTIRIRTVKIRRVDDKSKTRTLTKLVEWLNPKHVWLDKSQKDATSAKLFVYVSRSTILTVGTRRNQNMYG